MTLIIEALDKRFHERKGFNCGVKELNDYLTHHASQNQQNNISKIFVAVTDDSFINPKTVQGYYTLSAGHLSWEQLPDNLNRRLPKYPVPIVRIGRLARDINYKGTGLGKFLLYDALIRILSLADNMGVFAVVVDVKYGAKQFYREYGFEPLNENEATFFLPIKTIKSCVVDVV